jgi:hypothetical protein
MNVLFDTGSRLFWIRSSRCLSPACIDKPTYNSTKSSTFTRIQPASSRSIRYADGTRVNCTIQADTVTFGNVSLSNQRFCEATDIQTSSGSTDGVLGIAPPNSTATGTDVWETMANSTTLNQTIISFWYNRSQELNGIGNAGEITIGGMNASKFNGPLSYTNLTSDRQFWNVELATISVGSNLISNNSLKVIVDTGTTLALLPASLFESLTSHMPKKKIQNFYYLDCSKVRELPAINITFAGSLPLTLNWDQQVLMDLDQQSCLSIFQPHEGGTSNLGAVFGALLLRQFYTVFDYGQQRIGFAIPSDNVTLRVPGSAVRSMGLSWLLFLVILI